MKLRWMESGAGQGDQQGFNKAHGQGLREGERAGSQGGPSGWGGPVGVQMRMGRCTAMMEREKGEIVMEMGKA